MPLSRHLTIGEKMFIKLKIFIIMSLYCLNSFAISHGQIVDKDEFKSVFFYQMNFNNDIKSNCTGTFVNESLLITAAHCLENAKSAEISVNGKIFFSKKLWISPDFLKKKSEKKFASSNDVAFVEFSEKVVHEFSELDTETLVTQEDIIEIVGFGPEAAMWGFTDEIIKYYSSKNKYDYSKHFAGIKRKGINSVVEGVGLVNFISPHRTLLTINESKDISAMESGTYNGDSGGPIFHNRKLISVISGATIGTYNTNYGPKLSDPTNIHFIKEVLRNRVLSASM